MKPPNYVKKYLPLYKCVSNPDILTDGQLRAILNGTKSSPFIDSIIDLLNNSCVHPNINNIPKVVWTFLKDNKSIIRQLVCKSIPKV